MARGKYKLTNQEMEYGCALQDVRDALQKAIKLSAVLPEAFTTDGMFSDLQRLAQMLNEVANMHNNVFTLGKDN